MSESIVLRGPKSVRTVAVSALLSFTLVVGLASPVQQVPLATRAPVSAPAAEEVVGTAPHPLTRFGCLGCAAGLMIAGGGTVLGVVALATAVPHYFGWCAAGCYLAYR